MTEEDLRKLEKYIAENDIEDLYGWVPELVAEVRRLRAELNKFGTEAAWVESVARAREGAREACRQFIRLSMFGLIEHGDEQHRAWLKAKLAEAAELLP